MSLEAEVKRCEEKISRLEKERGSARATPDGDRVARLTTERDDLQRERDNVATDLKKVRLP